MSTLVFCGLMPHPPLLIPAIGKNELARVAATKRAMEKAAERLKERNPQTVVVITPHGPVFQDAVSVTILPRLRGNFAAFGAPETGLSFDTDVLLIRQLIKKAGRLGINTVELTDEVAKQFRFHPYLDHGALVPLYYITSAGLKPQIVHISIGLLPYEEMYTFGKALQNAINSVDRRVAVIASGDLSHRLTPEAPAGYNPDGKVFDTAVVEALRALDAKALLRLDRQLIENAGECGLRPIFALMGVLDGIPARSEVLSYEGPFGVGYAVVAMEPGAGEGAKEAGKANEDGGGPRESPVVGLARQSLETYVRTGKVLPVPQNLPPELKMQAGVFVSLKKHGQLRGCIGTFAPTQPNIAAEIIMNAINAGTGDPRFWPVEADELDELTYSVDILSPPEPVKGIAELDPRRYGVIVRRGKRSGLLLPDLEGIDTAEEQVAVARQKAGIAPGEPVELYRFSVKRYH